MKLHEALETYKIPKGMQGEGEKKLSPIFRDTAELTAHHSLPEKIRGAVNQSRFLILLCSPAAKQSHWVSEEILLFRKIHGDSSILCALIEGTPMTSFPAALTQGGREPLAANLSKNNFKLGVTQIAASMLGVGLDDLILRDNFRRRRRSQAIAFLALFFSGIMGVTAFMALEARNAAQVSRSQAEGLVEYMITDLKEKLEPLGRLDILDSVGDRAVEYYNAQDIDELPDESLSRQARARHILGQVALDTNDKDKARREIMAAFKVTKEVLSRNPDDTDAIFAHAQSEYWAGAIHYHEGNFETAMPYWQSYLSLGEKLYEKDPSNFDWMMERGWGANNMALLHNDLKNFDAAQTYYLDSIKYFELGLQSSPDNLNAKIELANALGGVAQIAISLGNKTQSLEYRRRQIKIYDTQLAQQPDNYFIRNRRVQAWSRLVTEGLLDSTPNELLLMADQSFNEFERLIEYEPENITWRRNYIKYLDAVILRISKGDLKEINAKNVKFRLAKVDNR